MQKLQKDFYIREDVIEISKDLLGKKLFTKIDGKLTGGIIVETEAYMAPLDKASHAYNNRRTSRTEVMYEEGGIAYVYLCYGIHYLFNVITNKKEFPHAILIRAIEPISGVETMLHRRRKTKTEFSLTAGPGSLSMALGINKVHNGASLYDGNLVWIEDAPAISELLIVSGPRVGVDYAAEYANKPWRFAIKGNPWISKPKI